jgi:hypothetical protein
MPRGDLLQVEIALENVQEFVVYQAGSMHAQQLRASRGDCREHDVEVRDALIMGKFRPSARASAGPANDDSNGEQAGRAARADAKSRTMGSAASA